MAVVANIRGPGSAGGYFPVGLNPNALTAVTAFVSGTCLLVYVGKAATALTTLSVVARVTTGVATVTWAEIAVLKGTPVANGAGTVTRLGFTDVSAVYNTTGIKKTAVALSGVAIGDDLWLCFGCSATTPFQLRGMMADDIQSGVFQTMAARPSTIAAGQATVLAGNAVVPPWVSAF